MKSLAHIQKLSKMGLIFSKIKFIFCCIGIIGCLTGLISISLGIGSSIKIGNIVLHGFLNTETGTDMKSIGMALTIWLVICVGEGITAWYAKQYFSKELADGTPFTKSGARELKRLGILVITVSLGTSILAEIIREVLIEVFHITANTTPEIGTEGSVILGIAFITVSLLCNYGAEQFEKGEEKLWKI